ncbi:MAG TPA: DUF4350 domain-containing protein [Acidimicrobiales bacterium]|nr:DUF4350 domain-containing protein [Acidimicrobiales bacterium]
MTADKKAVWRTVAVAVSIALALEVGFVVVTLLRRPPRGPESSSYAAGQRGARSYARLLERGGHDVRRQRIPVDVERPDPADTVVILGGERPEPEEVRALRSFVETGGRLVVAGDEKADEWLQPLVGSLQRGGSLVACRPLATVPETAGVAYVESSGEAGYAYTGRALPILGCNGVTLVAVATLGSGRIVVVSDDAVFQNYLLGARENAAFAVAAAGGVQRDVVFLEHLHGFGAPSGLAALPARWQLALAVLLLAALLALLARRRSAPAATATNVDHPRSAHADAVAERLAAAPRHEAASAVRAAARRAIAAAAGVPPSAPAEELRAAAARLGLPDDDVRLVLATGGDDRAAATAAGRVMAACARLEPPRPKERDA